MTVIRKPSTRTSPRALIRAFWALHRTLVRLTGGRLGLWRPKAGKRFGVMGLTTVGRRSGGSRTVIVGYFEDGPNLVTLAMNGWADREPAWWSNLKTTPHALVRTRVGSRTVRARPAEGDERERLWGSVDEYPGWGHDVDSLAANRPIETTVVVFEPSIGE